MEQKIDLIAIVGPTASGKSHLAVELAHWLNTEIISADSMQIYQGMQIGTAKPTLEEQEGIPHHLIDFVPPEASFSVADYVSLARVCIQTLAQRGQLPILVGGTGLYVSSLLNNVRFSTQEKDEQLCAQLTQKAQEKGAQALVAELRVFDPQSAQRIDPRNISRLVRAIELYYTTGKTMTEHLEQSRTQPSPYRTCMIGLDYHDRNILYQRIDMRVQHMVQQGLIEEANAVLSRTSGKTALQAIGYKELIPYFSGQISLEDAVAQIQRETRRYAKRQLTWFRRNPAIYWLKPDLLGSPDNVTEEAKRIITRFLQPKQV